VRTCGSDNTISSNTTKITAEPSLQAGKARARFELAAQVGTTIATEQPWHAGSVDFLQATEARARARSAHYLGAPFYPIIEESLPDLAPLTRAKWVDEQ